MINIFMGRTKFNETEEQRKQRLKSYQDKYYSKPENRQRQYEASQKTQSERWKRWYEKRKPSNIIQTQPNMIYYQVNNQMFFNPYVAHHESFKSGQPVSLYCYDDEYNKLDWTQEPTESFDELMGIHARNLRAKYDRLIFMWSGGTDSHTIYNIFKQHNIHVDEFIIKHSADIDGDPYPESHVDWLMKNHWDPTSKITTWNEYDAKIRGQVITNENWVFEAKGDLLKYGQSSVSSATVEHCERNHNGYKWGLVVGLEKPTVLFNTDTNRWYAYQNDKFVRTTMGHPNIECFYLDPMVNLKQSHMAKNMLKRLRAAGQWRNWTKNGEMRGLAESSLHAGGYRAWAKVVGRHEELTVGSSYTQKMANGRVWDNSITLDADIDDYHLFKGEPMLEAKLKLQDKVAVNYVKGFYNIRAEKDYFQYLNDNVLMSKNSLLKLKDVLSKPYDLGE